MAMAAPPRDFSSCSAHHTLSLLVLVQRQSIELPATTIGECRRRCSCEDTREDFGTVSVYVLSNLSELDAHLAQSIRDDVYGLHSHTMAVR